MTPAEKKAQEAVVRVPASTVAWLCGEAPHPVSGLWFERPEGAGPYWWRLVLRIDIERLREEAKRKGRKAA